MPSCSEDHAYEKYRTYMRVYMREYQRKNRDPEKHRTYERSFQERLRNELRRIFCPRCETEFERRKYERHPSCPGCNHAM